MSIRNPATNSTVGTTRKEASGINVGKFYTIQQIADALVVSTRTVRRLIHDKHLVAHRINGLVRLSEADFAAFLAARRDD